MLDKIEEWIGKILVKIYGSRNHKLIRQMQGTVNEVNTFEPRMRRLSDRQLGDRTKEFKHRLGKAKNKEARKKMLDSILPEAYAAVREAARRTIGLRHYDVQLLGGIALHRNMIAEMITGEGKTLVATCPVYLNALTGENVRVITVNDYLARRDREWMGPVYEMLGLTAGCIQSEMDSYERIREYSCDITYGTSNEFGFDYLRDNMKINKNEQCQKGLYYAIVDEVDSVLIDEARTPLIISGPAEEAADKYYKADKVARQLKKVRHFELKEKEHLVLLSEEGIAVAERALKKEMGKGTEAVNMEDWYHPLTQALRAHHFYKKNREYVIKNREIIIVDEFTGRLQPGRRWSDGLHQAIEAKEGVKIREESQTLATITLQNYFRLYEKLAGMTGTAATEAMEFDKIYKLEVLVVPPNRPLIRFAYNDVVFGTQQEKFDAIIQEIKKYHAIGRPLLVGTISIENSENLSKLLKTDKISHEVLNARYHAKEAQIIEKAGQLGRVTIATNMAGRGTDIVLGKFPKAELLEYWQKQTWKGADGKEYPLVPMNLGVEEEGKKSRSKGKSKARPALTADDPDLEEKIYRYWAAVFLNIDDPAVPLGEIVAYLDEYWKQQDIMPLRLCEKVSHLGGLHVVGSERHDARRIDNQLRGRCGRQGDPGSSHFFLSFEDDLLRKFAPPTMIKLMQGLGMRNGQPVEHFMINRGIEKSQHRVEAHNFEIRKNLLEYDEVMDEQRKIVYGQRNKVLSAVKELALLSREALAVLPRRMAAIESVSWRPDGKAFASAGDRAIILWDIEQKREIALLGDMSDVRWVAWSPDGQKIACACADGVILWDAEKRERTATLSGEVNAMSVLWGPGAERVAGVSDKGIDIWDARQKREIASVTEEGIRVVKWSPDGRYVAYVTESENEEDEATLSWDIVLWEVAKKAPVAQIPGHKKPVEALAWGPDSRNLAYCGGRLDEKGETAWEVMVWDMEKKAATVEISGKNPAELLAWSPDGKTLACVFAEEKQSDGKYAVTWNVLLWDFDKKKPVGRIFETTTPLKLLAWSPDGKMLAACSHAILFWNAGTKEQAALSGGGSVQSMSWSPDSTMVAFTSHDDTVIWDVKGRRQVAALPADIKAPMSLSWSRDENYLACAADEEILVWDIRRKELSAALSGDIHAARCISWHPQGGYLAHIFGDAEHQRIAVWDVAAQKKIASGETRPVVSLWWGPRTILALVVEGGLELWDWQKGEEIAVLSGTSEARFVSWRPIPETRKMSGREAPQSFELMACACGKEIDLWNIAEKKRIGALSGHPHLIESLRWSADGKVLAGVCSDGSSVLWDVDERRKILSMPGLPASGTLAAWSPDRELLATADESAINLWKVREATQIQRLLGHGKDVVYLAWSPDGKVLASASQDKSVMLWDAASGHTRAALSGHKGTLVSLAWSPDGKTLASTSDDETVVLWDVENARHIHKFMDHAGTVLNAWWSPDGNMIASVSEDESLIIWDVAGGEKVAVLPAYSSSVAPVCSPATVASAFGKHISLWDLKSASRLALLSGHARNVEAVWWSPDGKILCSASEDNIIRLWDVDKKEALAVLSGHKERVKSLSWKSDRRTFATASEDRTVLLWELGSEEPVGRIISRREPVSLLLWSPDGQKIACVSPGSEENIIIWDVDEMKQVAVLSGEVRDFGSLCWSAGGKVLSYIVSETETVIVRRPKTKPEPSPDGEMIEEEPDLPEEEEQTRVRWSVVFYDVEKKAQVGKIPDHTRPVERVSSNPAGTIAVYTCSEEVPVRDTTYPVWYVVFYDMAKKSVFTRIPDHRKPVDVVSWSQDGKTFAYTYPEEVGGAVLWNVVIWNVERRRQIAKISEHREAVETILWGPDGSSIACASCHKVLVLKLDTGKQYVKMPEPREKFRSMAWGEDGQTLAVAFERSLHLWDISDEEETTMIGGQKVKGVSWSPDGKHLLSYAGNVVLWDIAGASQKAVFSGHCREVTCTAWGKRGVASGSADRTVRLWDTRDGREIAALRGLDGAVQSVSWSADGEMLGCITDMGTLYLWDVEGEQIIAVFPDPGYTASKWWSPDKTMFAFTSPMTGGDIPLWNVNDMKQSAVLVGHARKVESVAWSPSGKTLASAAQDKTVRLWNIESDALHDMIWEMVEGVVKREMPGDLEAAVKWLEDKFALEIPVRALQGSSPLARAIDELKYHYRLRIKEKGKRYVQALERLVLLDTIDSRWKDHLYAMDELRSSVSLEAYAQQDPKVIYKLEGYKMFDKMIQEIQGEVVGRIGKEKLDEQAERRLLGRWQPSNFSHRSLTSSDSYMGADARPTAAASTIKRTEVKVGRNAPCPCGSGKKYKHCCGK